MAKLKDKVQDALDENRMMVLGVQVLIGFDYRAVFEKGFEWLPRAAQLWKLGSLSVLLVTFALLIAPGADHRIAEEGEDSSWFHRYTTTFAALALCPFAVAMGIDLAIACVRVTGPAGAVAAGAAIAVVALVMWYGVELLFRPDKARRERMKARDQQQDGEKTDVRHKIRHALTEARVVLPGAQALLGFQFLVMMVDGFTTLPAASKWIHLLSLLCVALATILLITPAAYHRIVLAGEESEEFHKLASALVLAALVPLSLGMTGDLYVVTLKVTQSHGWAIGLAASALAFLYGIWFAFPLARRLWRSPAPQGRLTTA